MIQLTPPAAGRPYATLTATGAAAPDTLLPAEVLALYRAHGAVLLRGFTVDLDAFRRFAAEFCASSVFNESPDRQLLDAAHNIQSVNGGSAAFPLHPELSREPWKPDACFFCCLSPPATDGETTLCDGVEIVRQIDPVLRDAMAVRRLLYIQPASAELLAFWLGTARPAPEQLANPPSACPYGFIDARGQIVRVFSRPLLHRPMFIDAPAFGNFLLFARYFLGKPSFPVLDNGQPVPAEWVAAVKQVSDRLAVPIRWQKGDLIMIDNTRFMHGRNAIRATGERLIASYFGYLKDAPRNPEEPDDPPWRRAAFRPPQPRTANAIGI